MKPGYIIGAVLAAAAATLTMSAAAPSALAAAGTTGAGSTRIFRAAHAAAVPRQAGEDTGHGRITQAGSAVAAVRASRSPGNSLGLPAVWPRQIAVQLPPTARVGNGPDGLAGDPATHTLYASDQNADSVSVISTTTCHAGDSRGCGQRVHSVSLPAGASPQGLALDAATGTLYVADIAGNSISVINARTCNATDFSGCGQTPASIGDASGPIALAVDQATDTVYVANTGDNFSGTTRTVSVINGATCNGGRHSGCGQIPPAVKVGAGPDGVAVDQATDTVYVVNNGPANNGDTVSVIDGATCNGTRHAGCRQATATVKVGHGPFWIAVDQSAHTAYTANNTDSTVSVINTATCNSVRHAGCGQRTATVRVGYHPWAVTADRALHTVYVLNNWDDTMSVFNSRTCDAADTSGCGHRPPTSQVGKGPQAVLTDSATGTIYVANFTDSTVSVISAGHCDAATTRGCRHDAPVAIVGAGPDAIGVDQATGTVYVANSGSGTVSVISAAACNIRRPAGCTHPAATIKVGNGPDGIAVNDATATVYVANSGSGTVSVIGAGACNARRHSGCRHSPPAVHVRADPTGVAVDPATDTTYVTSPGANGLGDTVSVINGATCNSTHHSGCGQTPPAITVGTGPFGIAVDQATDTLYVANTGQLFAGVFGDTVSVINGATCNGTQHAGCGQAPATVAVGPAPFGIAINQATNTIYVASNNGGDGPASLWIINGATCDAASTTGCSHTPPAIPGVGRAPNGIAFDPLTRTVYTANSLDATVSVIDPSTVTCRHQPAPPRVAVGSQPEAIAIDPFTRTIYITDAFDGTLSILPESPVRVSAAARSPITAAGGNAATRERSACPGFTGVVRHR
jgi:DNA-binding beta-propeller fold protein YncE